MAVCCFFFFNDTATTEIYTLSLHDALPILPDGSLGTFTRQNLDMVTGVVALDEEAGDLAVFVAGPDHRDVREGGVRSEEHTSELQSRQYLVCRLLLEKKKRIYHIARGEHTI